MVFRFLDLPSELRNRIYEIAATSGDEPLSISRLPLGEDGNFAGLTRACVQIRAEYRPIQRRKAKLSLSFPDLDVFTGTFLTSAADMTVLPLEVHVRVSLTKQGWTFSFDSLPIIKVKVQNPRLDIRMVPVTIPSGWRSVDSGDAVIGADMASTQARGLNSLLLHSNKDWRACISNGSIGEVYIEMQIGFTWVEIVFTGRLGYRSWPKAQSEDEWRTSHGLQAPASWSHQIDFTFSHDEE